ncbi:MAG TPA: AprI/Inh family metalloprotease inhibitor [Caulobacteraceae bacterium]|jgi:hypothetical protein|nr:AprI/Inh family metalloprotease inhibitor [Caulobacteraceae bacterium]
MKLPIALMLSAATIVAGATALAADNEAGVPLSPAEAAGIWSLESNGQTICRIALRADHAARAMEPCGVALSAPPTGWTASADGMRLMDANGGALLTLHRWSNSLFIAHMPGGDLQLRRGR